MIVGVTGSRHTRPAATLDRLRAYLIEWGAASCYRGNNTPRRCGWGAMDAEGRERMMGMGDNVMLDLARAKATFQLRAIEAALCIGAQSKPDQNFPLRAANDATTPTQDTPE